MKPNYQNVRTYGAICEVEGQSIVECRLNGSEIASVLIAEPQVCLEQVACDNGEVRYGGKLTVSFLYENTDGRLCRAERGAEFFHKIENAAVAPAHTAVGDLTVLGVRVRREGGQVIASCIIEGKFAVLGERVLRCLTGGEGLCVKRTQARVYALQVATATVEGEDEFECDFIKDILLHGETAIVTDVRAGYSQADVTAELCMRFCALREGDAVSSYERLVPIRAQVTVDALTENSPCLASVRVLSAHVSVATDEERNVSKIVLSYSVEITVCAYEKTECEIACDAFSCEAEIALKTEKEIGRVAMNAKTLVERIHGTPMLLAENMEGKTLLSVVFPKVAASLAQGERGRELQGAVEAKALYKNADGGVEGVDVTLPFALPVEIDGKTADVSCAVYGFGLRVRASGEIEAEGTLKARISPYAKEETEYISDCVQGEEKPKKTCAVSVYLPCAGDDLWTTAKRLSVSPEGLTEANPELTFPLKGEERMLIYRQKMENSQK